MNHFWTDFWTGFTSTLPTAFVTGLLVGFIFFGLGVAGRLRRQILRLIAVDRGNHEPMREAIRTALANGPMHGYQLFEWIKANKPGLIESPDGVLYPTLYRMEEIGTLKTFTREEEGRLRRYYELTGKDVML